MPPCRFSLADPNSNPLKTFLSRSCKIPKTLTHTLFPTTRENPEPQPCSSFSSRQPSAGIPPPLATRWSLFSARQHCSCPNILFSPSKHSFSPICCVFDVASRCYSTLLSCRCRCCSPPLFARRCCSCCTFFLSSCG